MHKIKQEMIEAGRRLYQRGLVAANDGNISCRLEDNTYLITASGVSKGFLQPEDILRVDANGRLLSEIDRRPSIETGLHLSIYCSQPQIKAIVHAHPPYATAFALTGRDLNQGAPDEVKLQLGTVLLLPYAEAGSAELAQYAAKSAGESCALLLARHGAICTGDNVMQALFRMEALEHAASIIAIAARI